LFSCRRFVCSGRQDITASHPTNRQTLARFARDKSSVGERAQALKVEQIGCLLRYGVIRLPSLSLPVH
jgi:hypothetical protein